MAEDANVKVFCRVRPPNEREGAFAGGRFGNTNSNAPSFVKKCVVVPTSDPLQQTVILQSRHQNSMPKTFTFDRAFSETATQTDVFEAVGVPITQACLLGYNGTIFAYGQTGSGKTFTMQGPDHVLDVDASSRTSANAHDSALRGLVPRVFDYLFDDRVASSSTDSSTQVEHTFACSFLEIYNERVYDLLDRGSTRDATGLALRENGRKGVFVDGLIESVVTSAAEAAALMTLGAQNRRVGQTAMNRESSRSHSVFIVQIQSRETTADGITKVRTSRFNLVDLAGSERQRTTEAAGERLKEAGSINKSLSALGNVIMGLVEQSAGKNRHVHYRDSKLTFLLKDSLGGNAKTVMIATVSPADDSAIETLSTLKFAQRAKLIRNNAVINEDATGSIGVLQEEIQRLRRQLERVTTSNNSSVSIDGALSSMSLMTSTGIQQHALVTAPSSSDPAVDARFRELESAFATAVEKHSALKRSHERLQVQDEHVRALCSELKRQIAHLQLVLRLRSARTTNSTDPDDAMAAAGDYEPSVDAIEWRLKYDELEENFAELQDEVQRMRMAEQQQLVTSDNSTTRPRSFVEGELEQLNLLLLALTTQLAHVVRDKHELQDRLFRLTASVATADDTVVSSDNNALAAVVAERLEHDAVVAKLKDALATQRHDIEGRVNAAVAARDVADAKTRDAARELLVLKQQLAAAQLQDAARLQQLADAEQQLRDAEDARARADALLVEQTQQHEAERLRIDHAHAAAVLALDARVADVSALLTQRTQQHVAACAEAAALRDERTALEQHVTELTASCAALTAKLAASDAMGCKQQTAIELLTSQLADAETALADARVTIGVREQRVATLERDVVDGRSAVAALETQLTATRSDVDDLRDREQTMQRALAQATADAKEFAAETERLTQQLSASDAALADTQMAVCNLTQQRDDTMAALAALKTASAAAQEKAAQTFAMQQQESATALAAAAAERAALVDAHAQELQRVTDAADTRVAQLETDISALRISSNEALAALQQTHDEELQQAAQASEARYTALQQQFTVRSDEAAAAQLRVHQLASDCSSLETERAAAVAALQQLEAAQAALQQQLAERDAVVADLQTDVQQVATARDGLGTELAQRNAAVETLEAANAALTTTIADRNATVATLTTESERLAVQFEAAAARVQALDDAVAAAERQVADTTRDHEAAVAALTAAHAAALQAADKTASAAAAALRDELEASHAAAVEVQRNEYHALERMLQQRTDDAKAAATAAATALENAETRAVDAERVVQTQREELMAYSTRIAALDTENETLRDTKQALVTQSAADRADYEAATTALQARLDDVKQELAAARAGRTDADAQYAALTTQLATLDTENKTLRDTKQALETRVATLDAKNKSLARECATHSDLVALADTLAREREQLDVKQRDVECAQAAAAAAQSELASITLERDALALQVRDLEPRVAQLTRERSQLASDAAAASARLDAVERANDALVGHTNKRQKIQYHFRVKEENNRLQTDVRQLTDDKYRLEKTVEKLRRALRDRDAAGSTGTGTGTGSTSTGLARWPSASSVSSINSVSSTNSSSVGSKVGTKKVSKVVSGSSTSLAAGRATSSSAARAAATAAAATTKKLVPVVSPSGLGGLENSSLAPARDSTLASKKRQHSRIERA